MKIKFLKFGCFLLVASLLLLFYFYYDSLMPFIKGTIIQDYPSIDLVWRLNFVFSGISILVISLTGWLRGVAITLFLTIVNTFCLVITFYGLNADSLTVAIVASIIATNVCVWVSMIGAFFLPREMARKREEKAMERDSRFMLHQASKEFQTLVKNTRND